VHGQQGERAVQPPADRPHGVRQGCPGGHLLLQQVRDDLGVGLAGQLVAAALQLRAQRREVLDDAVVDHGQPTGAVPVRVGVAVRGRAVGGPPGVSDPAAGVVLGRAELLVQVLQPAGPPLHQQAAVQQRQPGRVVPAVLQPAQTVEDNGLSVPGSDVPDDPAHGVETN
jgi:hypothetical protein